MSSSRTSWFSVRTLLVVGSVLIVLAAVGFAFVAGWGAANRAGNATRSHIAPEPVVIAVPEYGLAGSGQMPDVRGLTEEEAVTAVRDAGVSVKADIQYRPAAGAPGTVIQQSPVFGVANPSSVLLVVSRPAKVPKLAGKTVQEAVNLLQGMGARVTQTMVYDPDAKVGDVVRTAPSSGSALPETVTLMVADQPVERALGTVPTVGYSGASYNEEYLLGGKSYDQAFELYASDAESTDHAWQLDGAAGRFTGQVALSADSQAGERAEVVILADGDVLFREAVTSSSPFSFAVSVQGVETLTVRVIERATSDDVYGVSIVLLDPVLLGSYDQMQALPDA